MDRRKFLTVATGAMCRFAVQRPGNATAAEGDLAARVRRYLDRALAAGSPSAVCGVIRGGTDTRPARPGRPRTGRQDGVPARLDRQDPHRHRSRARRVFGHGPPRRAARSAPRVPHPAQGPSADHPGRPGDPHLRSALLPPNLLAEADPYDPYAHYTLDDLAVGLAETTLSAEPGSTYEYSNLGFGLLGQSLAFDDVPAMLEREVTPPLRLPDTTTTLRPDMASRKAVGHLDGDPVPDWHDHVLTAAGTSIYSTADDMLRYLGAQLRPERSPLRDAIELTQRPHFTVDENLRLGLGWHLSTLSDGRTMTWHNGGTGGFSTCAAFSRQSMTAVVMMVNTLSEESDTEPRPVDALTFALLDELDGTA